MEVLAIVDPANRPGGDELIHRAQSGDFAAFEDLYHLHLKKVYAICLRMTADPSRAEEMAQVTFVRAWEKLGLYRAEGNFGGWIGKLAVNVVLADQRAAGRRRRRESGAEDVILFPRAEADEAGSALDLEQAIAALPPRARHVFVLHDVEGYRHDEIARMLNVATGTSKAQLHRARKLLREALRR
jgi:RNA polymerase sigma-70 factor (ECF subfamily)